MECISFEEKGRAHGCRGQKRHLVYQSDSQSWLNSSILAKLKKSYSCLNPTLDLLIRYEHFSFWKMRLDYSSKILFEFILLMIGGKCTLSPIFSSVFTAKSFTQVLLLGNSFGKIYDKENIHKYVILLNIYEYQTNMLLLFLCMIKKLAYYTFILLQRNASLSNV